MWLLFPPLFRSLYTPVITSSTGPLRVLLVFYSESLFFGRHAGTRCQGFIDWRDTIRECNAIQRYLSMARGLKRRLTCTDHIQLFHQCVSSRWQDRFNEWKFNFRWRNDIPWRAPRRRVLITAVGPWVWCKTKWPLRAGVLVEGTGHGRRKQFVKGGTKKGGTKRCHELARHDTTACKLMPTCTILRYIATRFDVGSLLVRATWQSGSEEAWASENVVTVGISRSCGLQSRL